MNAESPVLVGMIIFFQVFQLLFLPYLRQLDLRLLFPRASKLPGALFVSSFAYGLGAQRLQFSR